MIGVEFGELISRNCDIHIDALFFNQSDELGPTPRAYKHPHTTTTVVVLNSLLSDKIV